MTPTQAKHRIRQTFLSLRDAPEEEREQKLRRVIKAVFDRTRKEDQPALRRELSDAFPVWPPDVPPPPPPTEQEMAQILRMRMDASDANRRRVENLLREWEVGCGLKEEDVRRLREKISIDADAQPEVGRTVEALLVMVQSLSDADTTLRKFLQEHGLGIMFVGVPRLRDTVARLLTLPDDDEARHARLADVASACAKLNQAIALLAHWPQSFADEASKKLAPKSIEAGVPGKFIGTNYEGFWSEYVARLGGRKDEANVKAELLKLMQSVMRETVS